MYEAIRDAEAGILPVEKLRKHYEAWRQRYQEVLDSFHFKFSKELAYKNLPATEAAIKNIGTFLNT
ncbi:hypothetical protein HYW87_03910 [Candidatus Roizmanbacteria bacterium]|nr:hypothetical protein [Candidatus Roizmanbacteria bacterium]